MAAAGQADQQRDQMCATTAVRVLEALPAEVALLDPEGVVIAANAAWRKEGGMPIGSSFTASDTGRAGDDDLHSLVTQSIDRVLRGRSDHVELEVPVDSPDGRRWKLLLFASVEDLGAIVTRVDVTRSHEVLDIVSETALRDGLTRLPNRSLLEDRIATAVARTERGQSAPAILFMDLNRFKVINDELGHEAGDRVLATVGQRLSASLRAADSCGRWGGDEFVAIVEVNRKDDPHALSSVIDRICETLNAPLELDGMELDVGVSIGAVLVRPGDTPTELVAMADAAMYEAKRSRRRAVVAPRDVIDLRLGSESER
jgi:diguanylate cyclase (GGDEF)-like protein